jgi:hypothetical protein
MRGKIDKGIRCTMMFRLMFGTQDDHYVAESAQMVLDTCKEQTDKSCAAQLRVAALHASWDVTKN